MPTIREHLSAKEMGEIRPAHGWDDGRAAGFCWCRFDAIIDAARYLRAEITFDDDSEFVDNATGEATCYFDPELKIESNNPNVPGCGWQTWDYVSFPISRQDVYEIVMGAPEAVLTRYADRVAMLQLWEPGAIQPRLAKG
jgi:hypothetical protein